MLPDGRVKGPGFHFGVDLRAAVGTPVFAVGDGAVEAIERGSSGLILRLRLDTGERVSFVHLEDIPSKSVGDRVAAGEAVALSGDSGGVAPHLHLEVRGAGTSHATDPVPFLRTEWFAPGEAPPRARSGGAVILLGLGGLLWLARRAKK